MGGKPIDVIDSQGDGYIRYSNGIQICWGTNKLTNVSYIDVSYPKAFIRTPITSTAVMGSGGGFIFISNLASSTFRANCSGGVTSALSFNYIAIGKWK